MIYQYWLGSINGIGNKKIQTIRNYCGSAEEFYALSDTEIYMFPELSIGDKELILRDRRGKNIETDYKKLGEKDIKIITLEQESYPKRLGQITDAPYLLYYRGSLPKEDALHISIVGARYCSEYGKAMAMTLSQGLAAAGVQIISGMARGIDAYCHMGTLEGEGQTFAVLGCGVDVCYPKEHKKLYTKIMENGGVISEYPPGTEPKASLFPPRNRIISGLSDVVVVVEAREKSGSLITADFALEQGRDIYAVPGRIEDALSGGCNRLIKHGAGIILSLSDFLKDINIEAEQKCKKMQKTKNLLEKHEVVVYSELSLQPKSIEEIMQQTGCTIFQVSDILMSLQRKGIIKEIFKNNYIRNN